MAHPIEFEDVWLRIERAKANRESLKAAIKAWGVEHPNSHRVVAKHDSKGNVRLIARVTERPPKEWGLLIGDVLVDLRCALDYAVYALAVLHGPKPIPDPKSIEFPVARLEKSFARGAIKHLPPPARGYIESIQPYQAGYGGPDGTLSPLYILNELVGVNKHRFIHPAWGVLEFVDLHFSGTENVGLADQLTSNRVKGELKDGAELASFRVVALAKKAKVEIKAGMTVKVAFEEASAFGAKDVYDGLGELGGPVESIVGHLERYI